MRLTIKACKEGEMTPPYYACEWAHSATDSTSAVLSMRKWIEANGTRKLGRPADKLMVPKNYNRALVLVIDDPAPEVNEYGEVSP